MTGAGARSTGAGARWTGAEARSTRAGARSTSAEARTWAAEVGVTSRVAKKGCNRWPAAWTLLGVGIVTYP
ncbi:hypothetical protein BpHYR1_020966 [Brachionus plicatilis]|uniref:Uncharacterized protein n=1 Tax=Brachionus plicatilis TaxID=10195 RepID=A0A3M7SGH2_BRAPC|nr:hypothetical protein BpHYR1_020966 [Brachionus plicatilis]